WATWACGAGIRSRTGSARCPSRSDWRSGAGAGRRTARWPRAIFGAPRTQAAPKADGKRLDSVCFGLMGQVFGGVAVGGAEGVCQGRVCDGLFFDKSGSSASHKMNKVLVRLAKHIHG